MREIKFRAWVGKMEYDVIVGRFGSFYVNPGVKGDGLDEKDSACLTPFNTKYPDTTPIMQFTGLHDKNGLEELFEGDIIDSDGIKKGNKYETPSLLKNKTNLVVERMGTKAWRDTEQEAMVRGCQYSK